MTYRGHLSRRGECQSPTDPLLIGNPLDFIAEDHLRIRTMCGEIDRLAAAGRVTRAEAECVVSFLTEELPMLVADEDRDLLPLLIRRSTVEDDMKRLKSRLDADHAAIMATLPEAIETFRALAERGGRIGTSARHALQAFVKHIRGHIILENAIVLPFARLRLTSADLETLARRMLQRRGLDRLMEN